MQQFYAENLHSATILLNTLLRMSDSDKGHLTAINEPILFPTLNALLEHCIPEKLNLPLSAACIEEVTADLNVIKNQPLGSEMVFPKISEIEGQMRRELKATYYIALTSDEAKYLQNLYPFSEGVMGQFPDADYDILEASKSFALSRYTATVFHCMRTMEVALTSIAQPFEIPIENNPSWFAILDKIKKALNVKHNTKDDEWQRREPKYKDVFVTLTAVKDAWRNPTMHVKNKYDQREALDIYNAVGAFMRNLATNPPNI